jgi:hypothetical protein
MLKGQVAKIIVGVVLIIVVAGFYKINSRLRSIESTLYEPGTVEVAEGPQPQGTLLAVSYDLPASLSFAGEPVPLQRSDVREQLDKEMQINTYFHSNTMFLIKRANRWLPQFEKILMEHDIPSDFKYMPLIESALLNDISPRQAVGFWQIIKAAGRENGLEITHEVDERYDPLKATVAACKYLRKSYSKFNNWTLAAASYDRGVSGLNRALQHQKVDSYYDLFLNEETSRYVFRLLAIKEIIEHPELYGFKVDEKHLYQQDSMHYVEVDKTISDLVDFARENGINYKLLKLHNPWLRDDRLSVGRGKKYEIAIPVTE